MIPSRQSWGKFLELSNFRVSLRGSKGPRRDPMWPIHGINRLGQSVWGPVVSSPIIWGPRVARQLSSSCPRLSSQCLVWPVRGHFECHPRLGGLWTQAERNLIAGTYSQTQRIYKPENQNRYKALKGGGPLKCVVNFNNSSQSQSQFHSLSLNVLHLTWADMGLKVNTCSQKEGEL